MTFVTFFHGFFLWHYLVRNKNAVIDFRMTFNTSYVLEVGCLIGKPFMLLYYIYLLPVGEDTEIIEIGMTIKAYRV